MCVGIQEGVACIDYAKPGKADDACGICVKDCGKQTDAVCKTFGLINPGAICSVSAAGGGGRCGKDGADNKTFVCCVVAKINNVQDSVEPEANGVCKIVNDYVPARR